MLVKVDGFCLLPANLKNRCLSKWMFLGICLWERWKNRWNHHRWLSAIMFWHPSKNWNQCPFTPEGLFTLWSSEVTLLGQTLCTESQCVVILLMVQKSGWPVDMENLPLLARLYLSQVVISEPSTVVCHSSRLSDFTCQYLFMLFKNLSAVLPATHFEPLWQELNSP